jgi:hypothetical protein
MSRFLLLFAALVINQRAMANETAQWEGVYERSGKTIKTGEWMGIGGGIAVAAGAGMLIGGGAGAAAGLGSGSGDSAAAGAGTAIGGVVVAGVGYTAFAIGPTLTAGGAMRQSKAVRKLNPNAPYPWLGTSSWICWGLGFPSTFVNPAAAVLLHTGAYVTAGLQKGKNRMNWDARTKAVYEASKKSRLALSLAPVNTDKFQGLMVFGSF